MSTPTIESTSRAVSASCASTSAPLAGVPAQPASDPAPSAARPSPAIRRKASRRAGNLRDVPTDTAAGKRTLAVRLGEPRTRLLYVALVVVPYATALAIAATGLPWALLALATAPLAVPPTRRVLSRAAGPDLVAVLKATGVAVLAYGVVLGIGLAASG
jgi:hypothetical protein